MSSLSEPFIRRPVGTTLLAIGLFLVGCVAYQFLPVAAVPTVDFPVIRVSASRPGADPAHLERRVVAEAEHVAVRAEVLADLVGEREPLHPGAGQDLACGTHCAAAGAHCR